MSLAMILAVTSLSAGAVEVRMSWQDAVARLAQERAQVEGCVSVLKAMRNEQAIAQAVTTYMSAKAETDAVIAALVVALARNDVPASLSDLNTRLGRVSAGRDTLCRTARTANPMGSGVRGGLMEIIGAVLGPLADAVRDLVLDARNRDALVRKTIQTQVEATAWPAFSDIKPATL